MPELPEVETVVRGLRKPMVGARVAELRLHRQDLRWPIPSGVYDLVGQRIVDVRRFAKTVVVVGVQGNGWLIHLGMSGRLLIVEPGAHDLGKHDHVVVTLETPASQVVFNDPRRFGAFDAFEDAEALDQHPRLVNFGVDPTTQALSAQWLYEQTRNRRTALKAFLLDQRHIAGLGNIYVSEALFRAGLLPTTPAQDMDAEHSARLVHAIKATLADAIAAGGSSLRDYVQADGELGYFQHQWCVYGRQGEPCRVCKAPVQRIVQQGRSTYLCATCQS